MFRNVLIYSLPLNPLALRLPLFSVLVNFFFVLIPIQFDFHGHLRQLEFLVLFIPFTNQSLPHSLSVVGFLQRDLSDFLFG